MFQLSRIEESEERQREEEMTIMSLEKKHKWTFPARFRRNAYGWRSSRLAVQRIREAVSEIKKVARRNPALGAEGAVLFLEKISPALMCVDSSTGALGTAVCRAIDVLVPIIIKAPAHDTLRDTLLERLWQAVEEDRMPYLELLPDLWGELCVTPERASYWADEFIDIVRQLWDPHSENRGHYNETNACLSSLYKAGRYVEILELLELAPYSFWFYREWGVKALIAMNKPVEALRYAEDSRGLNEPDQKISQACEEILLESGMVEEAYNRYSHEANQKTTYVGTFKAIEKKYPWKNPAQILEDLIVVTTGRRG